MTQKKNTVLYVNTRLKLDTETYAAIRKNREVDGIPITTSVRKAIEHFFKCKKINL